MKVKINFYNYLKKGWFYNMIRGIVYGESTLSAKQQLKDIIFNYECLGIYIKRKRESLRSLEIEFENGDFWRALKATENCRGMSCNVAYIEHTIAKEVVWNVIKPTIKSLPFQAYEYF